MKKKDKQALMKDMQGLFQGANMQNAQVNMFVERGAKVVYKEVVVQGRESGARDAAAAAAGNGAATGNGAVVGNGAAVVGNAADRHFPLTGREDEGRQWYEFLMERGFIDGETTLADWLFLMGFSTACPDEVKPIAWLKTVETARLMLRRVYSQLIADRRLTVARMEELAAQCFTKQGVPLRLAKPKREYSQDVEDIERFLPTAPDQPDCNAKVLF